MCPGTWPLGPWPHAAPAGSRQRYTESTCKRAWSERDAPSKAHTSWSNNSPPGASVQAPGVHAAAAGACACSAVWRVPPIGPALLPTHMPLVALLAGTKAFTACAG